MSETETLGRFGHHPDPAIDFEVEVGAIEGELSDLKHGLAGSDAKALGDRISTAIQFRVGGVPAAVAAKDVLRRLETEYREFAITASRGDFAELAGKLNERAAFFDSLREWGSPSGGPDREAASAILALQAEKERLEAQLDEAWGECLSLKEGAVLRAAIARAERAEAGLAATNGAPVAVKALEWQRGFAIGYRADTAFRSKYSMRHMIPRDPWTIVHEGFGHTHTVGSYPTEEEALKAAQADFEARVRSTLAVPSAEDASAKAADVAKAAWNAISDEHNGWHALSLDERETFTAFANAVAAIRAGVPVHAGKQAGGEVADEEAVR